MWQFLVGFCGGVYLATYYDCKPAIDFVGETVKEHWPKKKEN